MKRLILTSAIALAMSATGIAALASPVHASGGPDNGATATRPYRMNHSTPTAPAAASPKLIYYIEIKGVGGSGSSNIVVGPYFHP